MKAIIKLTGLTIHDLFFDRSGEKSRLQSTVDLWLRIPDRGIDIEDCSIDASQPWGTEYGEPIEVGPPKGYDGPWDTDLMSDILQGYITHIVGPDGIAFRIEKTADRITFKNCSVKYNSVEFEIDLPPG